MKYTLLAVLLTLTSCFTPKNEKVYVGYSAKSAKGEIVAPPEQGDPLDRPESNRYTPFLNFTPFDPPAVTEVDFPIQ